MHTSISKKEFLLMLITMALTFTYISCESEKENYRILQSTSNFDFLKSDTCPKIKVEKPSDCFAGSVNSNKCCSLKMLNSYRCLSFDEKSEVKKSLDEFGGLDKMNIYLTTNLLGSAEVTCSDKNPISEDLKSLANNCGSFNNPSLDGCAAYSNKNVECCYSSMLAKNLGNIDVKACAGIIAPIKMPSFSMSQDGQYSSLLCSVNSQEKNIMDSCGSTVPEKEADCTKFSKGDVLCKFATYEKAGSRVKMCMGMKGNVQMMMDLGFEPRLRSISLNQVSVVTTNESGKINVNSFIFYLSLVVLSFIF